MNKPFATIRNSIYEISGQPDWFTLDIHHNNAATNDPCTICNARSDPECGPDLFLHGTEGADGVLVRETVEAETHIDREHLRRGWQAILDNFAKHAEVKDIAGTTGNYQIAPADEAPRASQLSSVVSQTLQLTRKQTFENTHKPRREK